MLAESNDGEDPIGFGHLFAYLCTVKTFINVTGRKNQKMKTSTQDKVAGTAKKISGSVKEATGKATGNRRLEADGKTEKVEGHVQTKVGEIKKVLGT